MSAGRILGLQVDLVVPGDSRVSGMQAELVDPDGLKLLLDPGGGRPLFVLGISRPPGIQVKLWPGKWNTVRTGWSFALLGLPREASR